MSGQLVDPFMLGTGWAGWITLGTEVYPLYSVGWITLDTEGYPLYPAG